MMTHRNSTRIRIDFIPFVSTALLLILIFVWINVLQQPVVMGVTVPAACRKYEPVAYPKKVAVLVLLASNRIGVIQYRPGDKRLQLERTDFRPDGLRALLKREKQANNGDVAVVIKPSPLATFRNVNDALKELKLADMAYRLISELTANEQDMIRHYEQMFAHRLSFNEPVSLNMLPYFFPLADD
ncbi:biopolymer transporter ExbD [Spirosoma sp. KNUC1025]|uniref:biopolymer transporter ExbD n=1 Tax=Spirosoma sp. KNUC1025 TaxID=2894082 RepID=UPI00386FAEB5|nr:biopolymer transporter ExbD [Spirosoma sp. KNUC1025]